MTNTESAEADLSTQETLVVLLFRRVGEAEAAKKALESGITQLSQDYGVLHQRFEAVSGDADAMRQQIEELRGEHERYVAWVEENMQMKKNRRDLEF